MNNSNHLKKIKTLVQLSDGSSVYIFCYNRKKELLTDSDIKSHQFWKNNMLPTEQNNLKDKLSNSFKKLFNKKFK